MELIQLAEDNMVVLFNERFVSEKFERAIERNRDEFDEATAVTMAMTNLIQTALLAASKKFEEDSSSKNWPFGSFSWKGIFPDIEFGAD